MFNFSFGEIFVILAIGLLVVGPERLPETARFLAHWLKRIRRQVGEVQTDIRREMKLEDSGGLEEMKSGLGALNQMKRDAEAAVRNTVWGDSGGAGKIQAEVKKGGDSATMETPPATSGNSGSSARAG